MSSLSNKDFTFYPEKGLSIYSVLELRKQSNRENVFIDISPINNEKFKYQIYCDLNNRIFFKIIDHENNSFKIQTILSYHRPIALNCDFQSLNGSKYKISLYINNNKISEETFTGHISPSPLKCSYTIGSDNEGNYPIAASIGEIIVYQNVQNQVQKSQLWNYLKDKWDISEEGDSDE